MRERLKAHSDFLMVLVLFIAFRLMALLLTSPGSFLTRGYTDFTYYYEMATLSAQGQLPFVNFWFEYPPVFAYLAIGIYQLTRLAGEQFAYFERLLALVFLPFEVLVLVNVYRIACRVYDQTTALRATWMYALCFLPLFFWRYSFDVMVAGLTLQALAWWLTNRTALSATTLALAIATKFSPVFLLGAVWRFATNFKAAIWYTLITTVMITLIFLPFLLASWDYTLASFRSLVGVSSWETIWALLDGNISYGDVGGLARHFDLAQAGVPLQNPPRLPMWATAIPFVVLFLFIATRPLDRTHPRQRLVFSGIMLMLFHLWSKGWSPQWITLVLPFIVLLYPNWRGVLLTLTLSFATLLDWPLAYAMGSPFVYIVGVLIRTALFALIGIDLYQQLYGNAPSSNSRVVQDA